MHIILYAVFGFGILVGLFLILDGIVHLLVLSKEDIEAMQKQSGKVISPERERMAGKMKIFGGLFMIFSTGMTFIMWRLISP